jgi:hypothetical protein
MSYINAKCQICGKGYHRCSKCKDIPHYKNVADTPECFSIYIVLREYREGIASKKEAAERLKNLDVDFSELIPPVARDIQNLLADEYSSNDTETGENNGKNKIQRNRKSSRNNA